MINPMKTIAIIGAGCAGTMVANQLRRRLLADEWDVVCIDKDPGHHYQPGYLYLPFGSGRPEDIVKPKEDFLDRGVKLIIDEVQGIDPGARTLATSGGETLAWDFLVVASGCRLVPDEVDGLDEVWGKTAFDFYTLEGATALGQAMDRFEGGRLVVNIAETPYKCPITPMEYCYLADAYLKRRGLRDRTEIALVTPLPRLLHLEYAADALDGLCEDKGIQVVPDFALAGVEDGKIEELGGQGREIEFDLLVSIPPNFGAEVIEDSELDDGNVGYMPTDKQTLRARDHERIYVIGDGADLPTSKAGSVAHFCVPILVENLLAEMAGNEPPETFDGHTNCFIETGDGKALMIDFAYGIDALPGRFPFAGVGPFPLLKASRLCHWGKVAFRTMYWHMLLPGRPMPFPDRFSMAGKVQPATSPAR